jgi:hypothetical protein
MGFSENTKIIHRFEMVDFGERRLIPGKLATRKKRVGLHGFLRA